MASHHLNITANGTFAVFTTNARASGIFLMLGKGGDLDTGTLKVYAKPEGSDMNPEAINSDTVIALGDQLSLPCGGDMVISLVHAAGGGTPDINVGVSEQF